MRHQALLVNLELFRGSLRDHILVLDLGLALLHLGLELLVRLVTVGFGLCQFRLAPAAVRQIEAKACHVVVAEFAVGVLIHILNSEIRAEFLLRQVDLRVRLVRHGLLLLHIRVLLFCQVQKIGSSIGKSTRNQRLGLDLGTFLGPIQQLL